MIVSPVSVYYVTFFKGVTDRAEALEAADKAAERSPASLEAPMTLDMGDGTWISWARQIDG